MIDCWKLEGAPDGLIDGILRSAGKSIRAEITRHGTFLWRDIPPEAIFLEIYASPEDRPMRRPEGCREGVHGYKFRVDHVEGTLNYMYTILPEIMSKDREQEWKGLVSTTPDSGASV